MDSIVHQNITSQQRDFTADCAKGIGILLVVLCHANMIIFSPGRFFHMALFFFVSGWLSSFSNKFGSFVIAKVKHIYVPFVLTEGVLLLFNRPLASIGITTMQKNVWESIVHIICFDNTEMLLSPLWFLGVLFGANIICYAVINLFRSYPYALAVTSGLLLFCGVFLTRNHINLPFFFEKEQLNVILVAQFFIVSGFLFKSTQIRFDKWWIALIGVFVLVISKGLLNLHIDMRINNYSNLLLWQVCSFLGIYLTMYLSLLSHKIPLVAKTLCYLGKHSLSIFIGHIICFKLVDLLLVNGFGYNGQNLSVWGNLSCAWYWELAYFIVGITIPLLIQYLSEYTQQKCRLPQLYQR
ncbi:MAG: acyltransferase family protein [Paludibacteraceae bacterium]|nr:acyltransferase family protein [Paludibacteraceae bacterium]